MDKKKLFVFVTALFCALSLIAAAVTLYAVSPWHPKNISDERIIEKGTAYTVRLNGVSDYDEKGFMPVTESFYVSSKISFIHTDEKGFAYTSYDDKSKESILGKYNTAFVDYEKYSFCGESFKNPEELEKFFALPDMIYDFDINKLSEYVQDVIQYKKHFSGRATVKVYRGRFVITEIFIGDEKIMEIK